jgi:hypothetical protein
MSQQSDPIEKPPSTYEFLDIDDEVTANLDNFDIPKAAKRPV